MKKGEIKMSKKTILIASVAALVLMVAGVSMASPMWGGGMMGRGPGGGFGPGMQPLQLTDSQQAEWKTFQEKNFQLKKERIQLMVKSGYLTSEQADAKMKMMESNQAFRMKNNLVAPGARLQGSLTEEQKADMKKMAEQRLALQKENMSRLVSAGQITQAQADARIQNMQERLNDISDKGFSGPGRGGPCDGPGFGGGPGGRGMMGSPRF